MRYGYTDVMRASMFYVKEGEEEMSVWIPRALN